MPQLFGTRSLPLLLAAAALGALLLSAPTSRAYTVKGSVECPQILEEDGNESYSMANRWWLLGYFTARNYNADGNVAENLDEHFIYGLALDYCREHLGNDWDDAAIEVYRFLSE